MGKEKIWFGVILKTEVMKKLSGNRAIWTET